MTNSELSYFHLIGCQDSAATKFMQPFDRTNYEVCNLEYVLHGRGFLKCNGKCWSLKQGDVYIMKKHESHCYYQDREDPWEKRVIIADGTLMENIVSNTLLPDDYVFRRCQSLLHYFDSFFAMYRDPVRNPSEEALLFHQLVVELASHRENALVPQRRGAEFLLKAELDRSMEERFILEQYAEKSGYTKSYLIRKFRQTFGSTPCEYLLRGKIRKAEELLRYTTIPVKEIADRLGFSGQSVFSRCFSQKTGMSPRQCREQG